MLFDTKLQMSGSQTVTISIGTTQITLTGSQVWSLGTYLYVYKT